MKRRFLSIAMALAMLLSLPWAAAAAETSSAAGRAAAYYASAGAAGWADAFALFSAGYAVAGGAAPADAGELTGVIWALAAGKNPHEAYPGLFEALSSRQLDDGSFPDAKGAVWINVHITSMLVLPHVIPASFIDMDAAEKWLVSQQLPDGSFAYFGTDGDVDLTAMALLALTDKKAVEAAAAFLMSKMTAGGGFVSPWAEPPAENACSVASVISGFVSKGIEVPEKMIGNLLSFQLADGSFRYSAGGSDLFSTQQALTALGDLIAGKSAYTRLPDHYFRDESAISMGLAGHVNQAARRGLVSGDGGFFRPADIMTRAEAARVLLDMLPIRVAADIAFTDVPAGAWYEYSARCAVAFGAMDAPGGVFNPGGKVTRLDLAGYLTAALTLDALAAMEAYRSGSLVIADASSIPSAMLPSVAAVMNEGIFSGDKNGNFMPGLYFTRDQLAALLNKLSS